MALTTKKADETAVPTAAADPQPEVEFSTPVEVPPPNKPEPAKAQAQPTPVKQPGPPIKEKVTYYSTIMEGKYLFGRGMGEDKKILPPWEFVFTNHVATLDDPERIAEVESHRLFNVEFRRISSEIIVPETKYVEGPMTTATAKSREA